MSTYETTIERNDEEIEIEVDFDLQPEERMTHDYPGCDASVDVNYAEIVSKKPGCYQREVELSKEEEDRIEEEIMDWVVNSDDERWDY